MGITCAGVGFARVATAIDPRKDVDGANPLSLGRLAAGLPAFPPATAQAVVALLEHYGIPVVVIDVGTNATDDGGLVGDVDPAVGERVAGLTPVPGGVGPVTTALLLEHTVRAARAVPAAVDEPRKG